MKMSHSYYTLRNCQYNKILLKTMFYQTSQNRHLSIFCSAACGSSWMNNVLAVTYVRFPSGDFSSAQAKIFLPSTLSTHDSTRAVEPSGSRLCKKNIKRDYNAEIRKLYLTVPVRCLISLDLFINMIISSLTFFFSIFVFVSFKSVTVVINSQ